MALLIVALIGLKLADNGPRPNSAARSVNIR